MRTNEMQNGSRRFDRAQPRSIPPGGRYRSPTHGGGQFDQPHYLLRSLL